jgi:hypothetical protein
MWQHQTLMAGLIAMNRRRPKQLMVHLNERLLYVHGALPWPSAAGFHDVA